MPMEKFDSYSIEDKGGDVMPFVVYGWSTYEESSVLAGQVRKVFIECYPSEEAARAAYPKAESGTNGRSAGNTFGHLPGEGDFVPGGELPDDY